MHKSMLLCCVLFQAAVSAQYRPDWNAATFYEEVNTCRSAVVHQAIKDYEQKGQAAGQTSEQLRVETVSMTPVFEDVALQTCPCAINEIAKDMTYASYKSTPGKLAGYMRVAACENIESKAMKSLTKERLQELRLN